MFRVLSFLKWSVFGIMKNKKVTNCYYNRSCSGVGDFLRGCCHLFDILNNNLSISFSAHDLGNYISTKCKKKIVDDEIFDTESYNKDNCDKYNYFDNMKTNLENALNNNEEDMKLFSNYSDHIVDLEGYFLSQDCKSFMKDNIIFSDDIEREFSELGIEDYNVIHFRLGDRECCESVTNEELDRYNINTAMFDIDYGNLFREVYSYYLRSNPIIGEEKTLVVLSDSNKFKDFLEVFLGDKPWDIRVIHKKSLHSSDNPGFVKSLNVDREEKIDKMRYVALDMKVISKASEIKSYSVYPWGSGFAFWLARIFDIPISNNSV
jgi:hypothetical protein